MTVVLCRGVNSYMGHLEIRQKHAEVTNNNMSNWYWTRFQTENVKYIGSIDLQGCRILTIKGDNKLGKTLILKLFRRSFVKEHDPGLIMDGFDEAKTKLTITDGSMEICVTRTITRKDSPPTIEYDDGRPVPLEIDNRKVGPETFLKYLASGFGLDPFALMPDDKANRLEREKYFRKIFPVKFSGAKVAEITGMIVKEDKLDLAEFESYLNGAEENRTALNREMADMEGAVNTLFDSLPKLTIDPVEDHIATADSLQKELNEKRRAWDKRESDITQAHQAAVAERKAQLARDIAAATKRLTDAAQVEIDTWGLVRDQTLSDERAAAQEGVSDLTARHATAKQQADEQTRTMNLRAHYDEQRAKLKTKALTAAKAQTVVDRLKDYRAECFRVLPIEGMEYFKGGALSIGGKDFDHELNTGDQLRVCILIGGQTDNSVRLFISDRTESLGPENEKWMHEAVMESDFQMICTRVTDSKTIEFERIE